MKINPEITIQNITFGGMSKKSFNINKMAKGIKQTIAVPSVRKTRGTNIATAIRLQVGFRLEAVLFASSDLMLRLDLPDPPFAMNLFCNRLL